MSLYPAQKVIAKKLLYLYSHPNYYRQQRIYLSGEMGVGKTYMASAVIAKMMKKHPIILVVPSTIINKWHHVLNEYANSKKYTCKIFNNKTCLNNPEILLKPNCVNLIPNYYFNRLFTYNKKEIQKLKFRHKLDSIINKPDDSKTKRYLIGISNYKKLINLKTPALLVYDEIHQINHSKLRCFSNIMINSECFGLFLTGTIFNMNLNSVFKLIDKTHPRLIENSMNLIDWSDLKIAPFMTNIWQYISLSISLKQVKSSAHVKKIHQKIVPIRPVNIDREELAFYQFAYEQLKELGKKPAVAKLMASNFLDYPQRPPEINIKRSARVSSLRRDTLDAVAMPLMNIKLVHTKKYQALLKYLNKDCKNKNTLIYVTDHSLIKTLTAQLNKDGYSAKHLTNNLKPSQYSKYINNCYQNSTSVFVVDPHQVNVGVDINGSVLIWYQLLLNMSSIIQAQRRIHRLNSKRDSLVIFLAYRLTYQEQLVHQISNAGKYNAASYGVQKRDNLTKLTGILLDTKKDKR